MKRKRILSDEEYEAQERKKREDAAKKPNASAAGPHVTRPDEPRPAHRPNGYRPEFVDVARTVCALGGTDSDLATALGVSTATIKNWRTQNPEFLAAIKEAKHEVFDPLIERRLAERAMGYEIDLIENKVLSDGSLVQYPVRKHIPPDVTAMIFWLKNRKPGQWRDRQELVQVPEVTYQLPEGVLESMSPAELKVLGKVYDKLQTQAAPKLIETQKGDAGAYEALLDPPER